MKRRRGSGKGNHQTATKLNNKFAIADEMANYVCSLRHNEFDIY